MQASAPSPTSNATLQGEVEGIRDTVVKDAVAEEIIHTTGGHTSARTVK